MAKTGYRSAVCGLSCILLFLFGCGGGTSSSSSGSGSSGSGSGSSTSFQLNVKTGGDGQGSISSTPAGIDCSPTCSASFASGTKVTLNASPMSNFYFSGWSGACSGTGPCSVMLSQNTTVTAAFSAFPTLTVALSGGGQGTVTSNPSGISCENKCTANFPPGSLVTLTATAASGSEFTGWSVPTCGANLTCTLTLTTSQTVTATFIIPAGPLLTVTLGGTGTGSVSSRPGGINCEPTCTASFPSGTNVQLTETPTGNSQFVGWSGGGCSGTNSTCTLTLSSNETVNANFNAPQNLNAINHILILAQENRSFDQYFGAMREYWAQNGYPDQSFDGLPQFNPTSGIPPLYGPPPAIPGCDPNSPPPSPCVYDPSNLITSYHLITQCIENVDPLWNPSHFDWDINDPVGDKPAALNGFVWAAGAFGRYENFYDYNGIRAMGYYDGGDLNYYYFMASNFATSDRWFMPMMTRTSPNREYLVAATSQGYVYPVGTDQNDMNLLTAQTIFQSLQAANISWKIYVDPTNSSCSGPPYDPSCLLTLSYIQNFKWGLTIPTQYPNNIAPISQYFTDLQNGTLPAVALFEPATDAGYDEHPSDYDTAPNNIQRGSNYVSSLINGLMTSSSWKDSVFFFAFDEFGGLYDHVSPQPTVSPDGIKPVDLKPGDVCVQETGPLCDFTYTGYRVPMMVISPYAKKNYVDHNVADNTAILKLIEERFNLLPLSARDNAQIDMSKEFLDFTNPPWMTPPTPPAQNLSGQCYLDKLP